MLRNENNMGKSYNLIYVVKNFEYKGFVGRKKLSLKIGGVYLKN